MVKKREKGISVVEVVGITVVVEVGIGKDDDGFVGVSFSHVILGCWFFFHPVIEW